MQLQHLASMLNASRIPTNTLVKYEQNKYKYEERGSIATLTPLLPTELFSSNFEEIIKQNHTFYILSHSGGYTVKRLAVSAHVNNPIFNERVK